MNQIFKIVKSKLFSNYAVYLVSNVIGSAIPFFFLPILTRYLSPEDYGKVATLQILLTIFTIFVGVNAHGALSIYYFELDRDSFKEFNFNLILVSIGGFTLVLTVAEICIQLKIIPDEFPSQWILVVVLTALFEVWSNLILSYWTVQEKPFDFGKFQVSKMVVNVSLSVLLVVVLALDWRGRMASIIFVDIVFGTAAFSQLVKLDLISLKLNYDHIKSALMFGVPLIPHALSGWITTYIDRFFIANMVGLSDVGIYSVGYQLGSIIGLLATSFNQVWSPYLFRQLSDENSNSKLSIVKFTYLYFVAICLLALLASLIAPVFINFYLGDHFKTASAYVPWITFGCAASGMYYMVVNYIFYTKKNHYLTLVTFGSALLNILLNYIFVMRNGAIGAAQATTITSFLIFFLTWFLSSKVFEMPWSLLSIKTRGS